MRAIVGCTGVKIRNMRRLFMGLRGGMCCLVMVLETIGIAPKGTVDVYEMLFKTADYLTRGDETGIFFSDAYDSLKKAREAAGVLIFVVEDSSVLLLFDLL
ncbi:putative 24-methylenesterol C-methyltransferase [Helianthus annuus]|nr:putative 24-methylenesterol C-methyltransferase [Helianthus annuus]KAJ0952573.1 putative 24-methylenesterol C-methyltransferase [Helianthus annuus]